MYRPDRSQVGGADDTPESSYGLSNSFIIRGAGRWGGCQDAQVRLSEYGVCRFVRWDPQPPHWKFLYDTRLTPEQIWAVLGHAGERWQITIE